MPTYPVWRNDTGTLKMTKRRAAASLDIFKEDPALPDGDCMLEYVLDPLLAEEVMPRVNRALGDDRARRVSLARGQPPPCSLLYKIS